MYRGMRGVVSDIIVTASSDVALAARVIRGSFCIASDKRRKCIAPPFDGGPFRIPKATGALARVASEERRARRFVRIFASDWRRFGLERRNFAGRVAGRCHLQSHLGARDNLPWAWAKCSAHEAPLRFRKNAPRRVVLMTWSHTCPTLRCPSRLARQSHV